MPPMGEYFPDFWVGDEWKHGDRVRLSKTYDDSLREFVGQVGTVIQQWANYVDVSFGDGVLSGTKERRVFGAHLSLVGRA